MNGIAYTGRQYTTTYGGGGGAEPPDFLRFARREVTHRIFFK